MHLFEQQWSWQDYRWDDLRKDLMCIECNQFKRIASNYLFVFQGAQAEFTKLVCYEHPAIGEKFCRIVLSLCIKFHCLPHSLDNLVYFHLWHHDVHLLSIEANPPWIPVGCDGISVLFSQFMKKYSDVMTAWRNLVNEWMMLWLVSL